MDGYQFIASILESLAWPIAIVATALVFRKTLEKLLPRLRLTYGEASVEFTQALQVASETAAGIEEVRPAALPAPTDGDKRDRFVELATVAPEMAVVKAWIPLAKALADLGSEQSDRAVLPTSIIVTKLLEERRIDMATAKLIRELSTLRNILAHKESSEKISTEQALRYKMMADTVLSVLAAIPAPKPSAT